MISLVNDPCKNVSRVNDLFGVWFQMLFTSSALNLYFPYDFCLSPKTEALVTFTVKFIPPLIAFVMSVVVTIGVYAMRYGCLYRSPAPVV